MLELARVAAVLAAPCELFPSRACLWQSSWHGTLVRVASAVLRSCVVVRVTRRLPVLTCARQLLSRLPAGTSRRDLLSSRPPPPPFPPSLPEAPSEHSRSRSRQCVSVWCLVVSWHRRPRHAYTDGLVTVAGGPFLCACPAAGTPESRPRAPRAPDHHLDQLPPGFTRRLTDSDFTSVSADELPQYQKALTDRWRSSFKTHQFCCRYRT